MCIERKGLELLKVASVVLNNFQNDSRVLKEVISLKRGGFEPVVIALHEVGLLEYEVVQGVAVHRIKLVTRAWSKNKIVQMIKYMEFLIRVILNYRHCNIFHCHDLNALPIGVLIKLLFNRSAKVIYDAHEYETETNGLRGIQKKLSKFLERSLISYANKVICVSDSIANEYVRLYKVPKPALVLNTPPYLEVQKKNIFREELGVRENQKIFLYQGGLSRGRGIELLLEAFSNRPSDDVVIVFMGYGPLEELVVLASLTQPTIFFKEAVPPTILLDYTSSADFGFSLIEEVCLSYRYCLPNKMFEYIMADVPILCSNLPEMKQVTEKYGVGFVIPEPTIEGVRLGVNKLLSSNQEQLRKKLVEARNIFNWEEQEKVLLGVYHEL